MKENITNNRGKTRLLFTRADDAQKRYFVCATDENFAGASVALATSVPEFVSVDAQRRVFSFGPEQALFEEPIKNRLSVSRNGPAVTRTVGINGSIYAIGRPLRIYRRDAPDRWIHHNSRMPVSPQARQADYAFNDLAGFSSHDMYAVGDAGTLWHFSGESWQPMPPPSSLDLRTVVCGNDGNIYITDSFGAVWSGRDGHWQSRAKGEGVGFRDSVWFAGHLWCAADFELCVLEGNRLIPAQQAIHRPMPEALQKFCSRLVVSPDGLYLLMGNEEGLVCYDGTGWEVLYDSNAYDHSARRKFITGEPEQKFWQIETSNHKMEMRFGRVGRKGRTQHKYFASTELCDREATRLIAERCGQGYIEQHLLTLAEAKARYNIDTYFDLGDLCVNAQIHVLDGDIALSWLGAGLIDNSIELLVINGKLSVDGDIDLRGSEALKLNRLLVLGNASTANLYMAAQHCVITGDLQLSGYLYCAEPHTGQCTLTVHGQTTAAHIILMAPAATHLTLNLIPGAEYITGDALAQYQGRMPFYRKGGFDIEGFISHRQGTGGGTVSLYPRAQVNTTGSLSLLDSETALQRYPELQSLQPLRPAHHWVLVCDGDLVLGGHLHLNWETTGTGGWLRALNIESSTGGVTGLLVAGNFTVNGVIANNDANGPFLCVRGNLTAQNIVCGGAPLMVGGDIHVDDAIVGFDNGLLSCHGSLQANYLVICEHQLAIGGTINAITVDESGQTLPDADYIGGDDIRRIVSSQVLSGQRLSRSRVIDRLCNGKGLIRKGVKPARLMLASVLTQYSESAEQLTELDLSQRALQEFPKVVLQLSALKSLKLNGNAIRTLPESIGLLTSLETLELDDCQLTALPASIGRLTRLKKLSLANNALSTLPTALTELHQLQSLNIARNSAPLPDQIGALRQLRELDAHGNKRLLPLPDSMAHLTHLETLSLAGCLGNNSTLVDFPQVLTRLPALKTLDLSGSSLNNLPPEITRLEKLESLNLSCALRGVKCLPDLSSLTHLRVLHFDGQRQYASSLPPPHALLRTLLQSPPPALQTLIIDNWGKEDGIYQDGHYSKGLFRDNLVTLPDTFGKLPQLRALHLRLNGLEALPPSLLTLKALEEIDLYGNKLSYQQIQTLKQTFPAIRLEVFNNHSELDSAEFRQARNAIHLINRHLATHEYQAAFEGYNQIICDYQASGVYAEYDYYYAYYGRQYALTRLLEKKPDMLPADEQMRVYRECVERSRAKPIWQESEQGKLQLIMQQEGYTGLARCLIRHAQTVDDRELALKYAEQACAVSYEYCAAHESKARILLTMQRRDEAYRLLTEILAVDDEFPGLTDIRASRDYKRWLAQQQGAEAEEEA